MKKAYSVAAYLGAGLLTLLTASSALAANKGDRLVGNGRLVGANNDFIMSKDGRFRFVMQSDCNLVQYQSTRALWASGTNGAGKNCLAIMQTDGNLVIYRDTFRDSNNVLFGFAAWATGTNGHPGAFVVAQGDGNTVVYVNKQALWATNTVVPNPPVSVPPNSGGMNPHPGCSFSRTDTKCFGVVMMCNTVWACGINPSNFTVIEEKDGWGVCGACLGLPF